MFATSRIELSLAAYRGNLRFIERRLKPGTQFCSVVKGNAYGHGIEQFVPMAEKAGVRHFAVFDTLEAQRVLAVKKPKSSLLIMGMVPVDALPWVIEHGIGFFVFNNVRLQAAVAAARTVGKPAHIHLELETGMNRTGFREAELAEVTATLRQHPEQLHLAGLCTHFAGAESINNYHRIERQQHAFEAQIKWFKGEGLTPASVHAACSAAVLRYPETHYDFVRVGILQYGFWPNNETYLAYLDEEPENHRPLKRVLAWRTELMSIKHVKRGAFVGYGTSYQAPRDMLVGTVPIGYSHGYARALSNAGTVLVRGKRCPIVGVVNMNLTQVDLTPVKDPQIGEGVTLMGKQGRAEVTVASFSELTSQLNYETLSRLPFHIPREVVG